MVRWSGSDFVVMAGHSRPKDGVALLAYVPAVHVLLWCQGVDARDKRGHDGGASAVIAREGGRSSNRQTIITGCPAFAGHDSGD
jgi:hypothetical protein